MVPLQLPEFKPLQERRVLYGKCYMYLWAQWMLFRRTKLFTQGSYMYCMKIERDPEIQNTTKALFRQLAGDE